MWFPRKFVNKSSLNENYLSKCPPVGPDQFRKVDYYYNDDN